MLRIVNKFISSLYNYFFVSVYQFHEPVCFLNIEDYDMSGNYRKTEPDIEDYNPNDEPPLDRYDVLTTDLLQMILGQNFELLMDIDRSEKIYLSKIMENYPGWDENVFFVLHYEFSNNLPSKSGLRNFSQLKQLISNLGLTVEKMKLAAAYKHFVRRPDGLLEFTDFLNILYLLDGPQGSYLGETAESIREKGLSFRLVSTMDMASLIECGLL